MNIHSPMNAYKMIPKFKSSVKYPQQKLLRRDTPLFPIDDNNSNKTKEGMDVEADIEPLLSSLQCLNDDFGSYAPVASSMEGSNKNSTKVQPSEIDFLSLGPSEVSEITNKLAKRIIEVGSDCGSSTTYSIDSYSFHSAETEPWKGNLTSSKELKALASTFRVHPLDLDTSMTNSLCDDSSQQNEVIAPPKVVIAQEQIDGEVEVQYSPMSTSTSLHSSTSPTSSSDADSKGSNSSESSSSILRPSKRAVGQYDPYGKETDFSLPEAPKLVRVHRKVQFSNLNKIGRMGSLDSLLESGAIAENDSDDSSTSLDYLMNWCGVDGAIECFDDDDRDDDNYD